MKNFDKEEQDFQDTYDIWVNSENPDIKKKTWDHMWTLVKNACEACCKTKAYGIRVPDLEGKALDATLNVMQNIRNGVHPGKLSSYVYLFCIGQLFKKKHIEWERSESYEEVFDNYSAAYNTEVDGTFTLCTSGYNQ